MPVKRRFTPSVATRSKSTKPLAVGNSSVSPHAPQMTEYVFVAGFRLIESWLVPHDTCLIFKVLTSEGSLSFRGWTSSVSVMKGSIHRV